MNKNFNTINSFHSLTNEIDKDIHREINPIYLENWKEFKNNRVLNSQTPKNLMYIFLFEMMAKIITEKMYECESCEENNVYNQTFR